MNCLLLNNKGESFAYHLRDAFLYQRTHLFDFCSTRWFNGAKVLRKSKWIVDKIFQNRGKDLCFSTNMQENGQSVSPRFEKRPKSVTNWFSVPICRLQPGLVLKSAFHRVSRSFHTIKSHVSREELAYIFESKWIIVFLHQKSGPGDNKKKRQKVCMSKK